MIHSFVPFVEIFLLLIVGGTALALVLLPEATMTIAIMLGLPLGAATNVLIIFLYTILKIPLSVGSIFLGHLMIIGILFILIYKYPVILMDLERPKKLTKKFTSRTEKIIIVSALLVIAMNIIYSGVHAVILPTTQYDSATNWTMRSKISYLDQHIAFDQTESRGMAKPQYPFLFHALQLTANQGQLEWNDAAANAILYLLSLSTFSAVFLLLRKLRGFTQAIACTASIIAIPLIGLHLAQGYGDLNLLQYFLLSLVCLGMWTSSTSSRKNRWLVLSGIFVASSVWTKSEGSVFGLLPWIVTVSLLCGRKPEQWKAAIPAILVTLALSIPWPIFAFIQGLSLTPHSSDTIIQLHPEGIREAILGLFGRGSFGITWYALVVLTPLIAIASWKKSPIILRQERVLLVWGLIMFSEILFIYLATPNVRFLLNAESFYRQMMIPAAMLILACGLCLDLRKEKLSH